MARTARREVYHVARGGHDGAVGQPWRYLAEAIGQEREWYGAAGYGVPDEDEGERGQAGSRQPGDRLAGSDECHEREGAEEADADQRGARAGRGAEDRVQREH